MQKKLEKQIKKIEKTIKSGDCIDLMYDGDSIARYEFTEWSIDSKTPIMWLRSCLAFEVSLKGRDINKVSIKFTTK